MISMSGDETRTSGKLTSYKHLEIMSDGYLCSSTNYEELGSRTIVSLKINDRVALSSQGVMLNYLGIGLDNHKA